MKILKELEGIDFSTRKEIFELLGQLSVGVKLGMPVSRPMPIIKPGTHELRLKDRSGHLRVFYYLKHEDKIFVFHFFRKKTRTTPKSEIETAKLRLRELL